ncbi:hypothetical protein ScPMuIL_016358 [Solemya velum]
MNQAVTRSEGILRFQGVTIRDIADQVIEDDCPVYGQGNVSVISTICFIIIVFLNWDTMVTSWDYQAWSLSIVQNVIADIKSLDLLPSMPEALPGMADGFFHLIQQLDPNRGSVEKVSKVFSPLFSHTALVLEQGCAIRFKQLDPNRGSVEKVSKVFSPLFSHTALVLEQGCAIRFKNKSAMDREEEDLVSMEMVFQNIGVSIGNTPRLVDVSGVASAGQILAIMGPSGAGKTTLLNVLAGRYPAYSGEVTVNGKKLNKRIRRKICCVLQQDVFLPNLTLKETLEFAAMVRLPDEMITAQKRSKVEELIGILDLKSCANTIVGDALVRGLSGGEKNRLNIACELITDPSLILLDEPTSGLDYSTAFTLMKILKSYSTDHNKTIALTIHQPSTQMFYLIDRLLLLASGMTAYYGSLDKLGEFFSSIEHPIPLHCNPADFVLQQLKGEADILNKILSRAQKLREQECPAVLRKRFKKVDSDDRDLANRKDRKVHMHPQRASFFKFFRSAPVTGANYEEDAGSVHISLMELDEPDLFEIEKKWPTSFVTQFRYLTKRSFQQSRTRIFNKLKVLETLILSFLMGLIWFRLPLTEHTLRDRMGVLFYISMHNCFTPLFDAVTSFPSECAVVSRERSAGWYRLLAYYLAKMTSELPLILIHPVFFITVVYWCVGLNGVASFFATIGTAFLDNIAGQSIGLFLGIVCVDIRKGITISTVVIMFTMLLGGFYTRHVPYWLNWVKYFSVLHYAFHCLLYLEFHNSNPILCSPNTNKTESSFQSCRDPNSDQLIDGDEVLSFYNINWSYWQYLLPLFAFIIVFRILGYLILRYRKPQWSIVV